jgi:plastocyanin
MSKLSARSFAAGSVLAVAIMAGCSQDAANVNDCNTMPETCDITGTVTGKVTDNTGAPVPNVRVHLVSNIDIDDVKTDTAGVYTFKGEPANNYVLSITKPPNYIIPSTVTNPRNIVIAEKGTTSYNFALVSSPGSPQGPGQWSVRVQDDFFASSDITVPKGTTVTWQSYGVDTHSVTSESQELFDSGSMKIGNRFSHTFNTSNEILQYHCIYHPDIMFGTIRVVDSD